MSNTNNNSPADSQSSFEVELDEYDTASSPDDLTDVFDYDSAEDEPDVSSLINIQSMTPEEDYPDVEIGETEDPFTNTELVIKFNHKLKHEALKWFLKRVIDKKRKHGAELLLRREPATKRKKDGLVVHVTAACWRQLEVAEQLQIKKLDYSQDPPIPREFMVKDLNNFLLPGMHADEILSSADRQIVVLHELKHLESLRWEKHVPGYPELTLYPGQSISKIISHKVHLFTSHHFITSYFPLHEEEELTKLGETWGIREYFDERPYEEIRNYFGDRTCIYFNFVAYYTHWLTVPSALGLLIFIMPSSWKTISVICFCLINMVFLTFYLIFWQRYQSTITYQWGTLKLNVWEEPRPSYWGTLKKDPITGKRLPKYPYMKTFLRTLFSSSVVLIACGFAIWLMYTYLMIEDRLKVYVKQNLRNETGPWYTSNNLQFNLIPVLPSFVYAIMVVIGNKFYRKGARLFTEWENHRTESQYERHLVWKLVVFEVANNFGIFFYTAFVLKDEALLRRRMNIFLMIVQVWAIIEQYLVPLTLSRVQSKMSLFLQRQKAALFKSNSSDIGLRKRSEHKDNISFSKDKNLESIQVMAVNDPRVEMSKVEGEMLPYDEEAAFDDFLYMFLQFGYIFLFTYVTPYAAFFAFLCNLGIVFTGILKRREVYKRPFATRVSTIGAWQQAFEFMAVTAVVTNCALIAVNLRSNFPQFADWEWILMWFIIEHIIIGIQYVVKKVVPKIPYKVKVAMAYLEYHSREAYKRERAKETRRKLSKVFTPIDEELYRRRMAEDGRRSRRSSGHSDSSRNSRKAVDISTPTGNAKGGSIKKKTM